MLKIALVSSYEPDFRLKDLIDQGAIIDSIGLGDNIVAPDNARVGVVYKNVGIVKNETVIPKIKLSSDSEKTINPGYKKVYRFYDNLTGYALGDLITLHDEEIPTNEYTLIDPLDETNQTKITNYNVRALQEKIFEDGKLIYNDLDLFAKKAYCNKEMQTLYPEIRRIQKPHKYYVDLSEKLLNLKKELIIKNKNEIKK